MTAAALIDLLQTFPADLPVHYYTNYDDISVERARIEYGCLWLEGNAVEDPTEEEPEIP